MDIGLKSAGAFGEATFCIGRMNAVFHCVPCWKLVKSCGCSVQTVKDSEDLVLGDKLIITSGANTAQLQTQAGSCKNARSKIQARGIHVAVYIIAVVW